MAETHKFQAEINQLLSLIINTFYSNKDIFLRELLSNASDALDKIRHESLSNKDALNGESNLYINIVPNKEEGTLTITDSGVGMTKSDLVDKLGTIAKSGTKEFMKALKENKNSINMIGQFGVGFYSTFLVADKVRVRSKNNYDEQCIWESTADGSFTVSYDEGTLIRGTEITLFLKKEHLDYLKESKIKELVKKHSEFISYPISLWVEKEVEVKEDKSDEKSEDKSEDKSDEKSEDKSEEKSEDKSEEKSEDKSEEKSEDKSEDKSEEKSEDKSEEKSEDKSEEKSEDKSEEKSDEPTIEKDESSDKPKTVKKNEFELLNKTKPLWTYDPKEVTDEQYSSFYKSLTNDWEDHLSVKHVKKEGLYEFTLMLFTPKRAPFNMFEKEKKQNNVKLYVKRVFITDDCKDFVPEYLNFVKGIIDSSDLPLNISREFLQDNRRIVKAMKKHIVKECLDMFTELTKDEEKYGTFYEAFSKNIKLGIYEDKGNRKKLSELLRFYTTGSDKMISLREYVDTMPETQKYIYYLAGEEKEILEKSPLLEKCVKHGYKVLLLTETIDEYAVNELSEYDGKKLVCLGKENTDFGESDKKKLEKDKKTFDPLCKKMKEVLGERVEKVVISNRLSETPCCLVSTMHGWSSNMEKTMKKQAMANNQMAQFMSGKRVFEINPDNVIIQDLKKRMNENKPIDDTVIMIYQTSMIDSGYDIDNPKDYTNRIYDILKMGLESIKNKKETSDKGTNNEETVVPIIE